MSAWYNEPDRFLADWLRALIRAGEIAPGVVDERDIRDVRPVELSEFVQCHFFAGIGLWSRALRLAGWPDSRPVWTGSCPCQPFSQTGAREGFDDDRHLWPAWRWIIEQQRPAAVFGEQVASLDGRVWLDAVLADLETAGYVVGAASVCAAGVGAPNVRDRLWFAAVGMGDANGEGLAGFAGSGIAVGKSEQGGSIAEAGPVVALHARSEPGPVNGFWTSADWLMCADGKWRPAEAGTFPLDHGDSQRVGRLRAYGNAINPEVAAAFIRSVTGNV